MKPISLKFQAFGPYVERQEIDFTKISKAGLFLICGETGSGKTVILDAMTYALYGKSSGAGRGDISTMRCQIAPNELNTEIEFVFEIRGKRYKFIRTIKYGRKNFSSSQNALFKSEDGVFTPFFENPKISDIENKAVELLGLKYDQFRQVIVLPQGQFEKLLVAKSSEKEEILVSLFGADKWQRIADNINAKINDERRKLDVDKANIERSISDKGCNSLDEMDAILKGNTETLQVKEKENKEVSKILADTKKEFELQNGIHEKFSSFEKFKAKLDQLKQQDEEIVSLNDTISKVTKAEIIKPIFDNFTIADNNLSQRKAQVQTETEKLSTCEDKLSKAKKIYDDLWLLQKDCDADKIKLSKLSEMTEIYKNIDEVKQPLDTAEKEYSAAVKAVETQIKSVQKLSVEKLKLSQSETTVYNQYSIMLNSYISNMSGTLAQQLEKDMPCPVCGSTEHPAPSKMLDTDVTNELLEEKKAEIDIVKANLQEKSTQLDQATESLVKQKDIMTEAQVKKEKLNGDHDNLLKNTDAEIKDINQLNATISALQNKIVKFEQGLQNAKDNSTQMQTEFNTSSATLDVLKKEMGQAANAHETLKSNFYKKLSEAKFADINDFKNCLLSEQEKAEINQQITDYKVECASVVKNIIDIQKEIENKEKPNIEQLRITLNELEENNLKLTADIAVITQDVKNLTELHTSLSKQLKKYEDADKKCRENQVFARYLRGDSGVSLQRYVLGVMLTSITTEANRLLENVHNGRYRLYCTLETTGGTRKAGLELEVFDNLSCERRSVVSLSGGEKFLVALSLSIGLSTVVQAQSGGIKLDAMFVDEGFGSLDPSSIGDALMILSNIKNSNGLVGIISHVLTLKENISTKIEVVKNKNGSKLSISI